MHKAVVAAIGAVVVILNNLLDLHVVADENTIETVATVVTAILVYLVPNARA